MHTNSETSQPGEAANMDANTTQETGGTLRVRLGVQPRTFQKAWKRTFGYAFESGRIVTDSEREAMESKYLVETDQKQEPKPRVKREPRQVEIPIQELAKPLEQARETAQKIASNFNLESFAAWAMFLIPTVASIRNTVSVSGAFSGDYATSLLITATVSITGILWIVSRAKISVFDMAGILVFQLFEAFSNMVQVFKNLMGSMAYGITTVSGKPSDLLDMVSTLANKDHRDTAVILALGVALFILAAQVKGLLLIKGLKK